MIVREGLVNKTICLGDAKLAIKVPRTDSITRSYYEIAHLKGKGNSKIGAQKDFSDKLLDYARENNYNFIFHGPGIEAKKCRNKRKENKDIGPHICPGEVFFMYEMPLEISKEDYKRFHGKLNIKDLLSVLKQRGANLQSKV